MKILLLEAIHPKAEASFLEAGFEVKRLEQALKEDELIDVLKSYSVVGIRSKTKITEKVLKEASHLSAIGAFCIGTNQIQTETAEELGIPVFNAPYSNTRSVAELVIAEIVCLSRRIPVVNQMAHSGRWLKSAKNSHEVRGKTLGIIGYGHIGSQVSVLAEALGMKVQYFDIIRKLPLGNSVSTDSMQELLKTSDFVTLHVPETEQTKNLITEKELSLMKQGSFLLNLSRGTVVDIPSLANALREKQIQGAAIDVYPEEPKSNDEEFISELRGLENVILTPHIGGSTEEAQENIGLEVSDSLIRFLKMGTTVGTVNFPNVEMAGTEGTHRILNVHKNVPGVLSEINKIVSDIGANIQSQNLSTSTKIGYLIMDVEKSNAKELKEKISQLSTSIKTKILY